MRATEFIKRCLEAGMPLDMALTASKAFEAECEIVVEEALQKVRAKDAARTRLYRASGGGAISAQLRAQVFERDGHLCCDCGVTERLECDHIHPVSKGGETTLQNLQTLCKPCNARKRDRIRKADSRGVRECPSEHAGQTRTNGGSGQIPADLTCEGAQVVILTSSLRSEGTQEANASFVDAPKPSAPEKPKSKPPKSSRGTRLPDDWQPSDDDLEVARKEGLSDEETQRAATEFRNYWCSRSRDATKLSWPKTWHNRILDVADRKRRNSPRLVASSGQSGGHGRGAVSFADIYARRHGYAED